MKGLPERTRRGAARAAVGLALAAVPIVLLVAAEPFGLAFPKSVYAPIHTALEALVVAAAIATSGTRCRS